MDTTYTIPPAPRRLTVAKNDRRYTIPAQPRVYTVKKEHR